MINPSNLSLITSSAFYRRSSFNDNNNNKRKADINLLVSSSASTPINSQVVHTHVSSIAPSHVEKASLSTRRQKRSKFLSLLTTAKEDMSTQSNFRRNSRGKDANSSNNDGPILRFSRFQQYSHMWSSNVNPKCEQQPSVSESIPTKLPVSSNSSTTELSSSGTSSTCSTSSSTICVRPMPKMSKPHFYVHNPMCIPDYAHLKKHLLRFQNKTKDQAETLKLQVLPWLEKYKLDFRTLVKFDLKHEETGLWSLKSVPKEKKELQFGRSTLLQWWRVLLSSLPTISQEDRCLYYECIIEVMGRQEFADFDYTGPYNYSEWSTQEDLPDLVADYRKLLNTTLKHVQNRLNQKAVYSSTIVFCAKILALCYFKIPGLAPSLLKALNVKSKTMKNLLKEMKDSRISSLQCQKFKDGLNRIFPLHLHQLMTSDTSIYQGHFETVNSKSTRGPIHFSGNWIKRWQSDDSELFFSFYKHYHVTLKQYISIIHPTISHYQPNQRNAILTVSPGYVYLASFFAGKIDSLIHRELYSVTIAGGQQLDGSAGIKTLGLPSDADVASRLDSMQMADESQTFNPMFNTGNRHSQQQQQRQINNNGQARLIQYDAVGSNGKPKALDLATKRYAECMIWCTLTSNTTGLYHDMINVWIRTATKNTLLMEAEGVFCLLDFIEQAVIELQKHSAKKTYCLIDIPFVLHIIDIILSQSDHTISLLRALSFIYMHFVLLTSHAALLDLVCNKILLDAHIFERLLLHWSKNVRLFFLRCLMWRVSRVWCRTEIRWNSETERMAKILLKGNKTTSATCDGQECLDAWQKKKLLEGHKKDQHIVLNEAQAYLQCSLEVHIVLETMMASLIQNHSRLQLMLAGLTHKSRLNALSSSAVIMKTSSTHVPDRVRDFSSQIVMLPPMTESCLHRPTDEDLPAMNENEIHSPKLASISTTYDAIKILKAPPLKLKRRSLVPISTKNGKEKILRLFNTCNSSNGTTETSSMYKDVLPEDIKNECSKPSNNNAISKINTGSCEAISEFYYTVSSEYSITTAALSSPVATSNTNDSDFHCSSPTTHRQTHQDENSSKIELDDSPETVPLFQVKVVATKRSYNNNFKKGVRNNRSMNRTSYNNKVNKPKQQQEDELPPAILRARGWQYQPSNHVYATKLLVEIKSVMHEYCSWLDKTQEARTRITTVFVPRLSLEWPRNWAVSQF